MFRDILKYGLIGGLIVGGIDFAIFTFGAHDLENGMLIGYAVMLLALTSVFVGAKGHRDTELGGVIRFWPALGMGLAISCIAGVFYVAAWEASQAIVGGDFISTYSAYVLEQARKEGKSAADIAELAKQMAKLKVNYANPLWRVSMTFFAEFFPVGLLVSTVSALLLRNPRLLPARPLATA